MAERKQQQALDALLGRALRDKEFRQKLVDNPEEVAKEANLSPDELKLVASGLTIGSDRSAVVNYCTEKACNEKGGARVLIWSPDDDFRPLQNPSDIGHAKPGGGV